MRIGIIGALGKRGKELEKLFTENKNTEVTLTCDGERNELDCLKCNEFDVAVIATPDWLHKRHVFLALENNKEVYLEKPMAINPDDCMNIIRASIGKNRTVYVGHNLRHFTVIKQMKEIIDSGTIGDVKTIWCQHSISYGLENYFKRWHKYKANIGSLLIHKACHDFDIINWFSNSHAKSVVAVGDSLMYGKDDECVEDVSSVIMELENGVHATYSQCHFAHRGCREYTVIGTKGTVKNIDDNPTTAVVQLFHKNKYANSTPVREWWFKKEQGFHGEADKKTIDEFVNIIENKTSTIDRLYESANAVKTGYYATESLRNNSIKINF